ncbi:uncharacterized protein LOC122054050 [Zingiber officinale]|uniref:uncharacterized protein LOC122054050 n=1 Tax=Zingiber officinale TaxID=94328 RepID=UPI001C4B7DC6|nr:uncharacterized protein LOC122054050 [Zingiber officinale]
MVFILFCLEIVTTFLIRDNMRFELTGMHSSFTEKMVGVIYLIMFTTMLEVLDLAIKHMLEVLACSHLSLATQNVFLNEFSHVVQIRTVDILTQKTRHLKVKSGEIREMKGARRMEQDSKLNIL